jgi:hypothetical protein
LVTATLCRATGKERDVSQIKLNGICGLTLKPLIGRTVEGFALNQMLKIGILEPLTEVN